MQKYSRGIHTPRTQSYPRPSGGGDPPPCPCPTLLSTTYVVFHSQVDNNQEALATQRARELLENDELLDAYGGMTRRALIGFAIRSKHWCLAQRTKYPNLRNLQ